jgi:Na+-transporting methylmalonyl-CoA/oxaloacetate decarboxylase gamma subunit
MKAKMLVGVVLIALGILVLAYQGISYTTKDTVAELGPLKVQKENKETIPLPPILGAVALVAGVAIVITSRGK